MGLGTSSGFPPPKPLKEGSLKGRLATLQAIGDALERAFRREKREDKR
jgi:hypothetical protein